MCKISWSNSKKRREEFPGTQFWAFNLNQPVYTYVWYYMIYTYYRAVRYVYVMLPFSPPARRDLMSGIIMTCRLVCVLHIKPFFLPVGKRTYVRTYMVQLSRIRYQVHTKTTTMVPGTRYIRQQCTSSSNSSSTCCSHINSSLQCTPWSQEDRLQ